MENLKLFLHKKIVLIGCLFMGLLVSLPAFSWKSNYADTYNVGNDAKTIKCFPNPATTIINFDFSKNYAGSFLEIFSFSGKKMTEVALSANNRVAIPLDNYFRGLYLYRLRDNLGQVIETGKFQVVK